MDVGRCPRSLQTISANCRYLIINGMRLCPVLRENAPRLRELHLSVGRHSRRRSPRTLLARCAVILVRVLARRRRADRGSLVMTKMLRWVSRCGLSALAVMAALTAAEAKTFRWANDGDANSMDPYARQETFLLLFD